jgi:hypothetical protein
VCERDCKRQWSHALPGQPVCNLLWALWARRVRPFFTGDETTLFTLIARQGPGPRLTSLMPTRFNSLLLRPSTSRKRHYSQSYLAKLASSLLPLLTSLLRHLQLPPRTLMLDPTPVTPVSGDHRQPSILPLNFFTSATPPPIPSRGSYVLTAPAGTFREFKVS